MFLTPSRGGQIVNLEGEEALKSDPNIIYYEIEDCIGRTIGPPIDNAGRLGRVIAKDARGYDAMNYAKKALERIKLTF